MHLASITLPPRKSRPRAGTVFAITRRATTCAIWSEKDDLVLFYHSSCKDIGIAGIMKVVKAAYPDPAQFDPHSKYYDMKSEPDNPRWYCVDVRLVEKFPRVVATKILKADPVAAELSIFKQGRLSIAPVSGAQWQAVQRLRADGPV